MTCVLFYSFSVLSSSAIFVVSLEYQIVESHGTLFIGLDSNKFDQSVSESYACMTPVTEWFVV